MKTLDTMKNILPWFGVCTLVILLSAILGTAQVVTNFDFPNRTVIKPATVADQEYSMISSPNSTTVSTLFDRYIVSLQTTDDALAGMSFVGIRMPVSAAKSAKYIYYKQLVRGSIMKDTGTRVILVLDVGGKRNIVEYPFGKKHDIDLLLSFPQRIKVATANIYSATLGIIVERKGPANAALVQIDSLDVTVDSKKN